MGRPKLDPEYVRRFMLEERNFQLTEPYVNTKTPLKGICLTCGEEGAPLWANIQQGRGACGRCAGNKPLDPEYVEKFMLEERNFQLTEPYVNNSTPMKGICLTCGEEGAPTWGSIQQGAGACDPCGRKKMAEAQSLDPGYVEKFMLEERNFQLTEPYVNTKTPMKGICLACGQEGAPTWTNVRKEGAGACGPCGRKKMAEARSLDPEYVEKFMLEERNFELTEPYVNSGTPMRGICLACGYEGPGPTWDGVKSGRGACRRCGIKKVAEATRIDPEYVEKFMLEERNFQLTEPYVSNSTPMKGICLTCGEEGAPTWSYVKNDGAGACRNCAGNKPLDPAYVRREMIKTYKFLPIEPYISASTPMRGICLVCKCPGAPRWNSVKSGTGACGGKCKKRGMDLSVPAVAYLVGGYVKDAGPSLKVGIAEAQRETGRLADHKTVGLDTHLATLHFPTGYQAKAFENELKDLIKAEPGNLYDTGLIFDGSTETFELDAADPEFVRDLLSRFGFKDVPVPSGLWMDSNYRSRFSKWALAA